MQHKSRRRDLSKLVYVERRVMQMGKEVTRRMWVAGDNVRPDDLVVAGASNIRPYKYAAKGTGGRPTYKPPHGPNVNSARYRKETALFRALSAQTHT